MNTFGSDPEFLLTINGGCVSAIGKIKGTPSDRLEINGHYFYSDNVLAECAVKPGKNQKEVIKNFKECLQIYKNIVRPYCLETKASEIFPESELLHEDARHVGCAKEFCAYEMKQEESPNAEILNYNLRSCGGHIHLGSTVLQGDGAEPILMVYMMDLFLGVPSLWLDKDDSSPRRRKLYGKAGRYRPKSYGVEYRSLSNFWLNSPDLVGVIYDLCDFCLGFLEQGKAWDFWDFDIDRFLDGNNLSDAWFCKGYNVENLRRGIDASDKDLVKEHMQLIQKILPNKIKKNMNNLIENYSIGNLYDNWKIK